MARHHHNVCGDLARNLLNRSGLQLIALGGAGAVSATGRSVRWVKGKRMLLQLLGL